jgi:hypothetical protein
MKKPLLFIFVCLLFSFADAQKIIPFTTPEAAGFSSDRLKRLDKEMNDWAQKEGCRVVQH